jgi:hypothetical protein
MNLFKGMKPAGATHEWWYANGAWRGWLRVEQWVYFYDERNGWVAIAKALDSIYGKATPI